MENKTREVLFRGKRMDNGAWETGSLVLVRQGCSDEQVFIADKMTGYHTPVVPHTVGQLTGLKDKTGRDIYEGDIVTGVFQFGMEVKYTVIFQDGAFGLYWRWNGSEHFSAFACFCNVEFTVIGNVCDGEECDHDCESCDQRAICNGSTYKPDWLKEEE